MWWRGRHQDCSKHLCETSATFTISANFRMIKKIGMLCLKCWILSLASIYIFSRLFSVCGLLNGSFNIGLPPPPSFQIHNYYCRTSDTTDNRRIQNYWVYRICPSCGILIENAMYPKVSVSMFTWWEGDTYSVWSLVQWLRSALSKGPNRVGFSLPSCKYRNSPVSETLCFLDVQNPRRWKNPEIQWFWVLRTIIRTLYNLTNIL
jgi:hypothetical protein